MTKSEMIDLVMAYNWNPTDNIREARSHYDQFSEEELAEYIRREEIL
jgi:hypothetical protein